jgi:hypothetical protein
MKTKIAQLTLGGVLGWAGLSALPGQAPLQGQALANCVNLTPKTTQCCGVDVTVYDINQSGSDCRIPSWGYFQCEKDWCQEEVMSETCELTGCSSY